MLACNRLAIIDKRIFISPYWLSGKNSFHHYKSQSYWLKSELLLFIVHVLPLNHLDGVFGRQSSWWFAWYIMCQTWLDLASGFQLRDQTHLWHIFKSNKTYHSEEIAKQNKTATKKPNTKFTSSLNNHVACYSKKHKYFIMHMLPQEA